MTVFEISLETANKFYYWGLRGSIIGAIISAIAICFLVWGTVVRDRDIETQLEFAKARTIKPQQHDLIVQLLSPDRIMKGPVIVNALLEGEAFQYREAIERTCKDAGFSPSELQLADRFMGLSRPGVFIWVRDIKHAPKHAGPIQEAFKILTAMH